MRSKMLSEDLEKLAEKYDRKASYFIKRIQNCRDPLIEKRLNAQYEFTCKAKIQLQTLQEIHERSF